MDMRKMSFLELNDGLLASETQQAFEEIQKAAFNTNKKTELVLTVKIYPPEIKDKRNMGTAEYSIKKVLPKNQSNKFYTKFSESGFIVESRNKEVHIDQIDLDFHQAQVINGGFKNER